MPSVFDTRGAVFEPEQLDMLLIAFQTAVAQVGPGIPRNTERQLGKLVVNMARRKINAGDEIDTKALADDAVGFIAQKVHAMAPVMDEHSLAPDSYWS